MKSSVFLLVFPLLFVLSCKSDKVSIITYDLKRSDFIESINVSGTVQAVNNYQIVAPVNNYGMMSVIHLADDGSYVIKGDTICILTCSDLSTIYETSVNELENMEAELKKLEADNALNLALLRAQLETTDAQLKISSLDSVRMNFAPPVKKRLLALEMEKATIEKRKIERKFISQKKIDDSEIKQMKSRIMQQQIRLQRMKDQIDALTVIAAREGFVLHTEAPTLQGFSVLGTVSFGGKIEEGSTVFSNMALLQFPDLSKMQVSSQVAESDYKRIEKGQKVYVSIDAVKDLHTTGKINRKMPVGKTLQSDSQVKTYEVIIDIDSCHLKMKPGLSANCDIMVKEVKDTIIVPTLAIFEVDSLHTVYVYEDDKFIPVNIETGTSNSSHTIVPKGLKGNETIALSEPPHNMIRHIFVKNYEED